jgi:hypothetical protein
VDFRFDFQQSRILCTTIPSRLTMITHGPLGVSAQIDVLHSPSTIFSFHIHFFPH